MAARQKDDAEWAADQRVRLNVWLVGRLKRRKQCFPHSPDTRQQRRRVAAGGRIQGIRVREHRHDRLLWRILPEITTPLTEGRKAGKLIPVPLMPDSSVGRTTVSGTVGPRFES